DVDLVRAVDRRRLKGLSLGPEQCACFADVAVRMDVDGLHPLAVDGNRQRTRPGLLGVRRLQQPAAAEDDAGGGGGGLEEIAAAGHGRFPRSFYGASADSLFGSPAMRLCHITRGWVMSHGVAWCSRQRLSQITASPGAQSWW